MSSKSFIISKVRPYGCDFLKGLSDLGAQFTLTSEFLNPLGPFENSNLNSVSCYMGVTPQLFQLVLWSVSGFNRKLNLETI